MFDTCSFDFILLLIILSFVVIVCIINQNLIVKEQMVNISYTNRPIKWSRDENCKYTMTKIYMDTLNEYKINETNKDDWVIYFPCTYNNVYKEIKKIKPTKKDQRIFVVNNSEEMSSKSHLWKNLVAKYGRDKAKLLSPLSYVLNDKNDMKLFEKEYDKNQIYIMKKNIQRQEGLKITNDKNVILDGSKENYVVVQELLQDPYIVKGRKTNMRFYVLLLCHNNEISAYVHNEGFIYYTKMPFKKQSLKWGHNITTGYIERWIYNINPLTHEDFRNYLDDKNRQLIPKEQEIVDNDNKISKIVFDRIYDLIKNVIYAMDNKICKGSQLQNFITFQLFGFDIAVDENLYPKVIEVNVGPNLKSHDTRDSKIKHKVVKDIFKTIKVVPNIDNGYIQII